MAQGYNPRLALCQSRSWSRRPEICDQFLDRIEHLRIGQSSGQPVRYHLPTKPLGGLDLRVPQLMG